MVDKIGPAPQEGAVRVPGEHCDGAGRVARAFVAERIHLAPSLFRSPTKLPLLRSASGDRIGSTSAMAGTMFAYAAHRQRLPLIRSRISSSLSVICSAFISVLTALGQPASTSRSIPTAEQICPGVQ